MKGRHARIEDLCQAVNVGHVGPSTMHRDANGVPFLMGKNIGEGEILTHNVDRVTVSFHRSQSKSQLRAGDIVVVRIGNSGQAAKVPESLTDANCAGLVIIKQPLKINADYLVYFLNSPIGRENSLAQSRGATRLTLNTKAVARSLVPVPPLAEQQRIVGVLDEAFAGLATAQAHAAQNLQDARALFQSYLQSVFAYRGKGWVEKALGDVFETTTGTTPPKSNPSYYGESIPFVKPPELCDCILHSAADNLSAAGAEVARTLPPKSVLVSCIGNLGKIGLNSVPVAFNQQINAILPNERVALPELMFYQSRSMAFKEQLEQLASGTTVRIVNKSKFNRVRVVLPPLEEQENIVAQLDSVAAEVERLEQIYGHKQMALASLKKSLLHDAFSGNL